MCIRVDTLPLQIKAYVERATVMAEEAQRKADAQRKRAEAAEADLRANVRL